MNTLGNVGSRYINHHQSSENRKCELSFRGLAIWGCVKSPNRHGNTGDLKHGSLGSQLWWCDGHRRSGEDCGSHAVSRILLGPSDTLPLGEGKKMEQADGAVTKMGREDVGYSMI